VSYVERLFSLTGKTALVTGASRGLGRGIARALLEAGAECILVSANAERLQAAADELSGSGTIAGTFPCDLTSRDQIGGLIQSVKDRCERLDILVNCAGTTGGYHTFDYPDEEWDRTLRIHVDAPFFLARGLGPLMAEGGGGSIVNITSINAERGFPDNPSYVAAKGALKQLTKGLAEDLGPHGIRVNNVGPGYFRTDMTSGSWDDPERRAQRSNKTILGRWGEPEDLAGTIILLASNASSYITGQDIYVDGGWLTRGL